MFLIDTNVVIAVIARRNTPCLDRFAAETMRGATLLMSSVVLYELRFGIAKSDRPEKSRDLLEAFLEAPLTHIDFDADDAAEAADIRAHLQRRGTPIGPCDVMIAAQAAGAGRRWSAPTAANSRACRACAARTGRPERRAACWPPRATGDLATCPDRNRSNTPTHRRRCAPSTTTSWRRAASGTSTISGSISPTIPPG